MIGVCGAIIVVLAASTVVLMCKLRNINTPRTARKDLGASPSINDSEAGQSIELSLRRTSHRLDSNETNMETNVQQNTATQRMNQQSQQTNTHQEQNYENVVAVSKDYMELKFAPSSSLPSQTYESLKKNGKECQPSSLPPPVPTVPGIQLARSGNKEEVYEEVSLDA